MDCFAIHYLHISRAIPIIVVPFGRRLISRTFSRFVVDCVSVFVLLLWNRGVTPIRCWVVIDSVGSFWLLV